MTRYRTINTQSVARAYPVVGGANPPARVGASDVGNAGAQGRVIGDANPSARVGAADIGAVRDGLADIYGALIQAGLFDRAEALANIAGEMFGGAPAARDRGVFGNGAFDALGDSGGNWMPPRAGTHYGHKTDFGLNGDEDGGEWGFGLGRNDLTGFDDMSLSPRGTGEPPMGSRPPVYDPMVVPKVPLYPYDPDNPFPDPQRIPNFGVPAPTPPPPNPQIYPPPERQYDWEQGVFLTTRDLTSLGVTQDINPVPKNPEILDPWKEPVPMPRSTVGEPASPDAGPTGAAAFTRAIGFPRWLLAQGGRGPKRDPRTPGANYGPDGRPVPTLSRRPTIGLADEPMRVRELDARSVARIWWNRPGPGRDPWRPT